MGREKHGFDRQVVVEVQYRNYLIVGQGGEIEELGVPFKSYFIKEIGDGASTYFWNDLWIGNEVLKSKFKRLARLDNNLQVSVKDRVRMEGAKWVGDWACVRNPSRRASGELEKLNKLMDSVRLQPQKADGWRWSLCSNGAFTTGSLTSQINTKLLSPGQGNVETLRNYLVLEKIEVFVWRARRKRLTVMTELDKRGVDLNSVRCPLCDDAIESVDHSLMSCKHSHDVWHKIFEWWGRSWVPFTNFEDLFIDTGQASSDLGKYIWQALLWTCNYLIWKNRNQKVFSNKSWTAPIALNEIQVKSFD
ncbi:uncharacterized protein [Rutidosis leptorrhynchoides]|uniref:uncharacterized protein n=1 Tax=Rutidosis leptorrhynchoides TaxID=125765 RepID=UPI003A9918E3